jgi:CHASE3 domain sensor protein
VRARLRRLVRALLFPKTVKDRLLRHLTAVLVLGAVGSTALLASYDTVHRVPAELQARSVPAVQDAVAFRTALLEADTQAHRSYVDGLMDTVGPGERFRQQSGAADQALSRLSDRQIDGDRGRRAVEVMNVLHNSYEEAVYAAAYHKGPENRPMREQNLREAETVLKRDVTGILPRLDELQEHQLAHIRDQTDVSAAEKAGWIVAVAALTVLALVVGLAWRLLWRRCGRLFSGWLAAALVLVGVLAVAPLAATDDTQDKLDAVHTVLVRLDRADEQDRIDAGAVTVRDTIASTSTAARAVPWLAAGCGLAVVCAAGGLLSRLYADYGRD